MSQDEEPVVEDLIALETGDDDFFVHIPDPALGPLGVGP